MAKRRWIVALADTHAGHKLGLLNPDTVLYEEDEQGDLVPWTPKLTAFQEYLWPLYQKAIGWVCELTGDDEVIVLHNGDATQGDRYAQHLVSTRMADQIIIGTNNLKLWLDLPNVSKFRIVKGTGSHVFDEGSSEILIAEQLKAAYPERDIACLYHGLLNVDGFEVDYAHHGPGAGVRDWTNGNMVRYYLKDLIAREWKAGRYPPSLTLRAHYHTWVWETVREILRERECRFDAVVLPSWCGLGEHGAKATKSQPRIVNGLAVFEIVDGRLKDVHPYLKWLDIRTREKV